MNGRGGREGAEVVARQADQFVGPAGYVAEAGEVQRAAQRGVVGTRQEVADGQVQRASRLLDAKPGYLTVWAPAVRSKRPLTVTAEFAVKTLASLAVSWPPGWIVVVAETVPAEITPPVPTTLRPPERVSVPWRPLSIRSSPRWPRRPCPRR